MGTALLKIKIMPESPETNLDEVETQALKIIDEEKGEKTKSEKEPVAFGLNAIILTFARDENLDSDEMIEKLNNIPHTSSAEIIDFRRAFG